MNAVRKGTSLERLVKALGELSASEDCINIESPAHLVDRDTGSKREIDVLMTYLNGNKVFRVAFECRDHSRKVDVPQIEAFYQKCAALDVDLSVMVSASGYTKNCVPKAAALGVYLHTVEISENFDWIDMAGVLEDIVIFKGLQIFDENDRLLDPALLVDSKGRNLDLPSLIDVVGVTALKEAKRLKCNSDQSGPRPVQHPINVGSVEVSGLKIPILHAQYRAISKVLVRVEFEFHRVFTALGFFRYNRTKSSKEFATAKSALRIDHSIKTLVFSGDDTLDYNEFEIPGSKVNSSARAFRRLVAWSDLSELLLEVGQRHHVNFGPASDTLSLTAFTLMYEEGSSEWDGEDLWPNIEKDGCATISHHDVYRKKER